MVVDLIQNVAVLLAVALLHNIIELDSNDKKPLPRQLLTGVLVGVTGLAVMFTPWRFSSGIVFDTRSILLSISGLFFGAVPTLVAVLMTAALRFYQGGAGAWTGVSVIVVTAGIGVTWRHFRRERLGKIGMLELYLFGVVVHIAMLLLMLTLPASAGHEVLSTITLPVLILYPLGTVLLGRLMIERLAHRQAEETMRQSEEKFRLAFSTIPDAISLSRIEDGRCVSVNKGFVQSTGYTEAEAIGKTSLELNLWVDPEGRKRFVDSLKTAGTLENLEVDFYTKDGRVLNTLASATIIETDGVPHIFSIIRDVTDLKQANLAVQENHRRLEETLAQLQQTQEQLVRQERLAAVGQLAGGIAHDFNNILVPIIGYAELGMLKIPADSGLYNNLLQIKRAAERAAALTRQILAFSRKQLLRVETLDLNVVITEFEGMLKRLIREDIELQTILHPSLRHIKADKAQIEQVIMNLVVNARDAMPSGGKLIIETANVFLDGKYTSHRVGVQPGPYILLTVSDTGLGMDAETQKHIFEPFFTTKKTGEGTGLGLATVFGIVKQHEGNILVHSSTGQGAIFKIYLPATEDALHSGGLNAPSLDLAETGQTILVVEDEEMVRQLVCETLEAHGYNVIEAANPAEGLQVAATADPLDLLLTDVIMPEMNGTELYRRLALIQPKTSVLFMSGYTDDIISHQDISQGTFNFLQKPFTVHGLIEKVKKALHNAD